MSALALLKSAADNDSSMTPAQAGALGTAVGAGVGAGGMYAYHRNKYGDLENKYKTAQDAYIAKHKEVEALDKALQTEALQRKALENEFANYLQAANKKEPGALGKALGLVKKIFRKG